MRARKLPPRADAATNPNRFWLNMDVIKSHEKLRVKNTQPLPIKNPSFLLKTNVPVQPSVKPNNVVQPLNDIIQNSKLNKDARNTVKNFLF